MHMHYSLYIDKDLTKPFQQRDVYMTRQGDNMHVKQGTQMEVVETKFYQILIDHESKVFSAIKKTDEDYDTQEIKSEILKLVTNSIDTAIQVFDKIKVIYNDDKLVKYECTPKKNEEVQLVWVEFDKKLKFYRSVTTKYKQKTKVKELGNTLHTITLTLNYTNLNKNPVIAQGLFNELNYIILKNNQIVGPAKKYSHYKYLNDNTP